MEETMMWDYVGYLGYPVVHSAPGRRALDVHLHMTNVLSLIPQLLAFFGLYLPPRLSLRFRYLFPFLICFHSTFSCFPPFVFPHILIQFNHR